MLSVGPPVRTAASVRHPPGVTRGSAQNLQRAGAFYGSFPGVDSEFAVQVLGMALYGVVRHVERPCDLPNRQMGREISQDLELPGGPLDRERTGLAKLDHRRNL